LSLSSCHDTNLFYSIKRPLRDYLSRNFFLRESLLKISPMAMAVILYLITGCFIAHKENWPLYTMFYASFKRLFIKWKFLGNLLSSVNMLFFVLELVLICLANPLLILLLSLSSFFLALVRLIKECEEIIAIQYLHSVLFSKSTSQLVTELDKMELTQIQVLDFM